MNAGLRSGDAFAGRALRDTPSPAFRSSAPYEGKNRSRGASLLRLATVSGRRSARRLPSNRYMM
jgi:hypothetical protein